MKLLRNDKEADKKSGRVFAKISHNIPWAAFNEVISQIKTYGNLINLIIIALNYVSNFGLDMLVF
jgi:Transcription- and export-related complex subunit